MTAIRQPSSIRSVGFLRRIRDAKVQLPAVLGKDPGAIDLASIMVGVLVIGIIAGVIASTVFAIVPWTQDNAAKQNLDSITTAESVARVQNGQFEPIPALVADGYLPQAAATTSAAGISPAVNLIRAGGRGKSVGVAALFTGDLNPSNGSSPPPTPPATPSTSTAVTTSPDGTCFVAASRSQTGSTFWITSDSKVVNQLAADAVAPATDCIGASFPAIGNAAPDPSATSSCNGSPQTEIVTGGNTFIASTGSAPVTLQIPVIQTGTSVACTSTMLDGTIHGMTLTIGIPVAMIGTATPTLVDARTPQGDSDGMFTWADTIADWQLTSAATVNGISEFTFTDTQPVVSRAGVNNGYAFSLGFRVQFDTSTNPAPVGTYAITYKTGAPQGVEDAMPTTTIDTTVAP
ncbi:MAG: hypothetical protein JWM49_625 [Microbacteriaceae bacterium]|nr:hypothetical protein [Microbacteriaceae bacterium]